MNPTKTPPTLQAHIHTSWRFANVVLMDHSSLHKAHTNICPLTGLCNRDAHLPEGSDTKEIGPLISKRGSVWMRKTLQRQQLDEGERQESRREERQRQEEGMQIRTGRKKGVEQTWRTGGTKNGRGEARGLHAFCLSRPKSHVWKRFPHSPGN